MSLVDRVNRGVLALRDRGELQRRSSDDPLMTLDDLAELFMFGGNAYPLVQTTQGSIDEESIGGTSAAAFKGNGPVFALVMARVQTFSQVRFQWTQFSGSQPGDLFGSPELTVLERPWPGGTTADLLARMEIHASLAGCAFVIRPRRDRLSMMRPDRVTIVMGSQTDADDPAEAPDAEIVGFVHQTSRGRLTMFGAEEVAYYAPIPDPDYRFLGMSWITPVIREMQADGMATEHKARFFQNAATPNLAIKFDPSIGIDMVERFKAVFESKHRGVWNAYKTLYLGGGADPVVIGKDFRELDFAATQGKGESRLAAAAGVPPSWVGFSEGLQGSSLNAGNFQAARRRFSDGTMQHLWTNAATSLETLLRPPNSGATLWFDPRVPFMREDAGDLAGIQSQQAATIGSLIKDGFVPETAVKAVMNNDWSLLKHSGLVSVQLQPPGASAAPPATTPAAPAGNGSEPGRAIVHHGGGHRFEDGDEALPARFDPNEPRDPHGKWTTGAGAEALIKSIHDTGGFTFNPRTGGLVKVGSVKGVAVAVPHTEQIVGRGENVDRAEFIRGVADVIEQHGEEMANGAFLGGWFSEDRDAYMVELTELVPDRKKAIQLGRERNQEGVFDLGTGEYVATGGTGG